MSTSKKNQLKKLIEQDQTFIIDTSAIIAYLHGEEGGELLAIAIGKSSVPFIALTELYYIIWKRLSKSSADYFYGIVKSWGLPLLIPDESTILTSARFKVSYALGIADSYIAAFAFTQKAILITKDFDFERIREEIGVFQIADSHQGVQIA